ncbi:MAG: ribonuclease D [Planctomycetes bacterium]|nr:ribonuclease D [Planctomycetota bacterium]
MHYEYIDSQTALLQFCDSLAAEPMIAFDTEFVSEDTYRPELCLVQVAAARHLAVIDPYAVEDLRPFWALLAQGPHETIVHAGREEFRFCRLATNRRPHAMFDVQIAAAIVGLEYPASYGSLLQRILGEQLEKGETRTNWRQRPLSARQLEYALQDVTHLLPLRRRLGEQMDRSGRTDWMRSEMADWQEDVERAETAERWRRVSGISGLSVRQLAIVREVWHWRDQTAAHRDWPPRRVLRDDLIVELAKRQTADPKRIRAVRGMERGDIQRIMPALVDCIQRALDLPDRECPGKGMRSSRPQLSVLGQFLYTALGCICREASVAPSLVGTVEDLRDLIAYRLGFATDESEPPRLARGWRAGVVGKSIDEFLDGKMAIRVDDPRNEDPLNFIRIGDHPDL